MPTHRADDRIKLWRTLAAVAASFILAVVSAAQNQTPPHPPTAVPTQGVHTISVKFDYDFHQTPACTSRVTKNCVQQFVVYDISAGASKTKRYKLFTVPVPPKPRGLVHGISGTSPPLTFESGKHLLAVTALESVTNPNDESNPQVCTMWVTIP